MTKVEKVIVLLIASFFILPASAKIMPKVLDVKLPLPPSFGSDLVGVTIDEPRPSLSLHGWLTREFQDQFSKWFNQNYGARPFFVRMGNQLNYTVFNKSYMNKQSIIIGRHGQLYEDWYINDYCNPRPTLPSSSMETWVREITELQHLLARKGVTFLLLISPSKAAIYPEYIPSKVCPAGPSSKRGYDDFIPLLDQYHVNHVDGHFITQQATQITKTPLFSQGSSHWNYLGAFYTVRMVIDELNSLSNRKAGRLDLESVNIDHAPTGSDKDLAELLNLFYPPLDYAVPHPVISKKGGTDDLGRAIIVGTSFNWIPIDLFNKHKLFEQIDFFYYYRRALHSYPGQQSQPIDVGRIDWANTMFRANIIILEVNEIEVTAKHAAAFVSDALQHLRNSSPQP